MKLIFHPTSDLKEYDAYDVKPKACYDGQVVDVPVHRVSRLMQVYPRNFSEPDIPRPEKVAKQEKKIKSIIPSSQIEYTAPKHTPLTLADISIVVINPYPDTFKTHLLPCIPEEPEFIPLENINNINWTSGAKALNYGIGIASNDVVICTHGDLILGQKWFENFIYHEARLENWGALGVVGWDFRNRMVWGNEALAPHKIQCLDECCVIVNRKNGIWFDEKTFSSWHCFAADFCLNCIDKGLDVYVMPGVASHEGFSFREVAGFRDERDKRLPTLWLKWKDKVPKINMGLKESMFRGEK